MDEGPAFETARFEGSKLVFCERFTEESDLWNLQRHEHPYLELIYFLGGGARIHGEGSDLQFSVYDLVVYPEHLPHKEDVDLSHHQEIVCLGVELPSPSGLDRIRRITDLDGRLRRLFVEVHEQHRSGYPHRARLVPHLVCSLLHFLKQAMDSADHRDDPVGRVIHFIHDNPARPLGMQELADLAACSPSYLTRRFRERTGTTPMRYLEAVRLDAAARLLERHDTDVARIARLTGFEDPRYFSRRFSGRFGCPPSRYREMRP